MWFDQTLFCQIFWCQFFPYPHWYVKHMVCTVTEYFGDEIFIAINKTRENDFIWP